MNNNLIKLMTLLNVSIYRLSNGRLGNQLGKQSVLLLHTIGRKSGKKYFTTLSYYREGENYLLVATNWGKENHPAWFYNLMKHPRATIQFGTRTIISNARQATEEEYPRLWQLVTEKNGQYEKYQRHMKRRIPIIVLEPIPPT